MLSNNIKTLRVKNNLTQDRLSKLCECTRQTINAIEKNKYSPSLVLAFKIAKVLNSEINEVFDYNNKDNKVRSPLSHISLCPLLH